MIPRVSFKQKVSDSRALDMKADYFSKCGLWTTACHRSTKWSGDGVAVSEKNKLLYINVTNFYMRDKIFQEHHSILISVILFKGSQGLYWSVGLIFN